jgi:hypothetical protein
MRRSAADRGRPQGSVKRRDGSGKGGEAVGRAGILGAVVVVHHPGDPAGLLDQADEPARRAVSAGPRCFGAISRFGAIIGQGQGELVRQAGADDPQVGELAGESPPVAFGVRGRELFAELG